MMYGAAASIHTIQITPREALREANLPFLPMAEAVSALGLMLQAQYGSLLISLGYTR